MGKITIQDQDLALLHRDEIDPQDFLKFCCRSDTIRNIFNEVKTKYNISKIK